MRTMYDSTNAADIPAHATMAAGYRDGNFRTVPELLRRQPPLDRLVTITVLGNAGAHVIDREPGDVDADTAAAWAAREVRTGHRPTIYCSLSEWPEVIAAVKEQRPRIAGKVSYWVAHYDGQAKIPGGAVAVQYADPALSHHHYDVSAVGPYWPGVDPRPHFARLRYGKRRTARKLTRELHRRIHGVDNAQDRGLLRALAKQLRRLLHR